MDPDILKLLQTRLINGEITQEEYEHLLSTLDSPAPQPPMASPPIAPPRMALVSNVPRVEVPPGGRYLNPAFYLWLWIGLHILALFLVIGGFVVIANTGRYGMDDGEVAATVTLFGMAGICMVVPWIFFYVMLYRAWAAIQHFQVRTSPGKAVGFCFIPFFNFYWNFVAIYGLVQDFNRVAQEEGRRDLRIAEGIGIVPPILICVNALPYIGCLSALGLIVMWPVYIWMISDRVDRFVRRA
ncbi:MAG: hypothetical protein MK085_02415 [Phycisphaerales bacterium]|nr:hypothetical protein [Phycisphaerales bacterium]